VKQSIISNRLALHYANKFNNLKEERPFMELDEIKIAKAIV